MMQRTFLDRFISIGLMFLILCVASTLAAL